MVLLMIMTMVRMRLLMWSLLLMLVVVVLVVVPAVAVATVVIMETCVPALFFRSKLLSCCWSAIRLLRRTQYHLQSIYSMVIT